VFKGVGSEHSDKENCFTLKLGQLDISKQYIPAERCANVPKVIHTGL